MFRLDFKEGEGSEGGSEEGKTETSFCQTKKNKF